MEKYVNCKTVIKLKNAEIVTGRLISCDRNLQVVMYHCKIVFPPNTKVLPQTAVLFREGDVISVMLERKSNLTLDASCPNWNTLIIEDDRNSAKNYFCELGVVSSSSSSECKHKNLPMMVAPQPRMVTRRNGHKFGGRYAPWYFFFRRPYSLPKITKQHFSKSCNK